MTQPSKQQKQKIGKEMVTDLALKVRQGQVQLSNVPEPLRPLVRHELRPQNDGVLTQLARKKVEEVRQTPKFFGRPYHLRRVVT